MKRSLTEQQKGVLVYITDFELEFLRSKDGFIPYDSYSYTYKDIALPNEVGRFLFFRFLEMPK